MSVKHLAEIKENSPDYVAWAITIAFNTGVRTGLSELLVLKWEHVNWDNHEIRVFATKTSTWRIIPVNSAFMKLLEERYKMAQSDYLIEYRGRPVKSLRKPFRKACIKAGYGDSFITYDARHLYATYLLSHSADLSSVSALLGHSSTKMTADVYCHAQRSEKQRAVSLLPEL